MPQEDEVIIIFHIASLGDTVISIPCYREIARRHPRARRYMLTNFPIGAKMVPAESLLLPMGLISGSIEYPMPLRRPGDIWGLRRTLSKLRPKILYYLTPETHPIRMVRHWAFFRACGIRSIRGVPWSKGLRYPMAITPGRMWETEGSRLLRAIGAKEDAAPPAEPERDLELSGDEMSVAESLLAAGRGLDRFIAISVGGKVPLNDWGDERWSYLLRLLSSEYPDLGVVFVGSADERERNDRLAQVWSGPKLNTCGLLTPRQTAALLSRAELFFGHDTGTLHLAAAAGTRVIGIYSARNVPGKWFSGRENDIFFYHQPECFGCEYVQISECQNKRICMTAHDADKIFATANEALQMSRLRATQST
jgi:ADP-heptose:LPS heptosyltransferase